MQILHEEFIFKRIFMILEMNDHAGTPKYANFDDFSSLLRKLSSIFMKTSVYRFLTMRSKKFDIIFYFF
jgi:hypothetical protein